MFSGCTNLKNFPTLKDRGGPVPAMCLYQAFYNCKNITSARIEIPNDLLILQCFQEMFYNASKLNHLEVTWTGTWNTNATYNWM